MSDLNYNPNAVKELNETMGLETQHSQQAWKRTRTNTNAPEEKKHGSERLKAIRDELNKS